MASTGKKIGFGGVIVAVLAVLGYAAAKSINNLSKLQVTVDGIDIIKGQSTLSEVTIRLTIGFYNPSDSPVLFQNFIGEAWYNEKVLSPFKTTSANGTSIKPHSKALIQMNTKVNTVSFASNAFGLITKILAGTTSDSDMQILIKGTLKADNLTLPIEETINMSSK